MATMEAELDPGILRPHYVEKIVPRSGCISGVIGNRHALFLQESIDLVRRASVSSPLAGSDLGVSPTRLHRAPRPLGSRLECSAAAAPRARRHRHPPGPPRARLRVPTIFLICWGRLRVAFVWASVEADKHQQRLPCSLPWYFGESAFGVDGRPHRSTVIGRSFPGVQPAESGKRSETGSPSRHRNA